MKTKTQNREQGMEPVHPCPVGHIECEHPTGITTLDYCAFGILNALMATWHRVDSENSEGWVETACSLSYDVAEKMMAERAARMNQNQV